MAAILTETVFVVVSGKKVNISLSPAHVEAIQAYADRVGKSINQAVVDAVSAAGSVENCAAEAGLQPTVWVRDVILHAIGYLPGPALASHRAAATEYVRSGR